MTRDRRKKASKGQRAYRPHSKARTRPTIAPPPLDINDSAANDEPGLLPGDLEAARWRKNRHGAVAGRGFHFQDAASAWLAARMLDDAPYESVVPEGSHQDLTCEGSSPVAYQMKSRVEHVGLMRASEAARHVRDLHASRVERGYSGESVLVLERDVVEAPVPDCDALVGDLPAEHPLGAAVARLTQAQGLQADAFDDIRVTVVGFDEARRRTAELIAERFHVPVAVAEQVALQFARMIADAVDHNAGATFEQRRRIHRTALVAMATRTIAETDPTKLTAAVDSGACEPARLDTPTADATYFEGLHAQPGHVAAGLPAWREELVQQVQAGLGVGETPESATRGGGVVLLTGPSGVGKSTVMWMVASATRAVTWFRVHRLNPEDVEDLCRLAEGCRPDATRPVGFLFDGVGLADVSGWDMLVRRVTSMPQVFLVGTAREEDTFQITTLTASVRVNVQLDEAVAEHIHAHLVDIERTTQQHWREAYEQANGLTLEYTHYLTRGQRLADVLGSQVHRLVTEGADIELRLLSLAATAHMHGVALPVRTAQAALAVEDVQLRSAVRRLTDEHFLAEDAGLLIGLHQQRSRALSAAVHAAPPPTFAETVTGLMDHLPSGDLPRIALGVLREREDVDTTVVERSAKRIEDGGGSDVVASMLHALRTVDFLRHARSWAQIIRDEQVPPAQWPLTVWWGLLDTELLENMNPPILSAVPRLRSLGNGGTPLRDALVAAITPGQLAQQVLDSDTAERVVTLLTACDGSQPVIEQLADDTWSGTPVGQLLAACSSDEFATVAGLGQWLAEPVAIRMVEAAGGEAAVLERIRADHPEAYEIARIEAACAAEADPGCEIGTTGTEETALELVEHSGGDVAYARRVWVDDELTPDPNKRSVHLARIMLRSLPGTVRADIMTNRAIDTEYAIGDLTLGSSGLLVKYSTTSLEQLWNKVRAVLVLNELGFATQGQHAIEVAALLPRTVVYLEHALTLWLTDRDRVATWDRETIKQEAQDLATQADLLTGSQDGHELLQQTIPSMVSLIEQLVVDDARATASATAAVAGLQDAGPGSAPGSGSLDGMPLDHSHSVLWSIVRNTTNTIADNELGLLPHQMRYLLEDLDKAADTERWDLIGRDGPPPEMDAMRASLTALSDIAAAVHHGAISPGAVRHEARSGPTTEAIKRSAEMCRRAANTASRQFLDGLRSRMSAVRAPVEIIDQPTSTATAYWPPVDFAVIVECADVRQWVDIHEAVLGVVAAVREDRYLPETVVCPALNGVREPALALTFVGDKVFPGTESYYQRFADATRPDPEAFDLVSDVQRALSGLLRRSALNYAGTKRALSERFSTAYDEAATQTTDAIYRIRAYSDDACIDALLADLTMCVDIVNSETESSDSAAGAFAHDFLGGALQQRDSNVQDTVNGLTLASIQWLHDPVAAVRLTHDSTEG